MPFFLITFYLLASLILSFIPYNQNQTSCAGSKEIILASNGVHVDIVIPVSALSEALKNKLNIPSHSNYVAFGWGDQQFYLETPTWSDIKLSNVFGALFLKSKTLMHVTFYRQEYEGWKKHLLCPERYTQLNALILNSFQINESGQLCQLDHPGYGYNDHFFKAVGNYSYLNTCNTWVNRTLKQSGVPTALWTPFPFGLLRYFD